jgi:hypothetical protein
MTTSRVLYEERQNIDGFDYPRQTVLNLPRDRYYFEEVIDTLRQNLEVSILHAKWLCSTSLPEAEFLGE